jgi:hypothetical protein
MTSMLSPDRFRSQLARFQRLIAANDKGNAFTNFHEGVAGVWENYKPRLRDHALRLLAVDEWSDSSIGSGAMLQRTIDAIEIQDNRTNLTNNLVFWQNRFGHANRDHRALLEAVSSTKLRRDLEHLLYGLFRGAAAGVPFVRFQIAESHLQIFRFQNGVLTTVERLWADGSQRTIPAQEDDG